jgi:hypothetical protein
MDKVTRNKKRLMSKPKMYKAENDPVILAALRIMPILDVLNDTQRIRVMDFLDGKYFNALDMVEYIDEEDSD